MHNFGALFIPKFEILQTANNQWFWRFRAAGNYEILCHSENYVSKQGAERGIQSLIHNIKISFPGFETNPIGNGEWFWRFRASNGEILCHSESYVSKQGAERGIQSLISNINTMNNYL